VKIHGFQKMTLLDFPGKVAATVFTAGCNMRCPFCHNSFLVTKLDENEELDGDKILAYLKTRTKILDGVAITGGEPLLWEDTLDFIRQVKDMGLLVKLDTNGTFPDRLKRAVEEAHVDYVAMDIKNSLEGYPETVGIKDFDVAPIKQSIQYLLQNNVDYEFRTTVVKQFHSKEAFESIGKTIFGAKKYYLQRFVDSGNLICEGLEGLTNAEMLDLCTIAQKYIPEAKIRG